MHRERLTCLAVIVALAVFGSTGCVSRSNYRALEEQKMGLDADKRSLEQQLSDAENDAARLREELAGTRTQLSKKEAEVASLAGTYDQLVSELKSEVASGQIEIKKIVDGISLNVSDELLFRSGSAELDSNGNALIVRVADQIKGQNAIVTVEGHTDNVALSRSLKQRYPSNWELAGARAASVVRLLSERGVDPTRLRAVSRGPFAPIADNDSKEGRARNRRTEITLRPVAYVP